MGGTVRRTRYLPAARRKDMVNQLPDIAIFSAPVLPVAKAQILLRDQALAEDGANLKIGERSSDAEWQ